MERKLGIIDSRNGLLPDIGIMIREFANGPGDRGLIPGRVIPKTQKMVPDASLLNTQHYKVRIKVKVGQSWEWITTLPYTSTTVANFTLLTSIGS